MKQNYTLYRKQDGQILLKLENDYRKARSIGFISGDTFSCKKSAKHLLRINNGLGIAYPLLRDYDFKFISIQYNGQELKTTKEFFLKHGKMFQFSNYELQCFLPVSLFGIDKCIEQQPETPVMKQSIEQQDLFAGVKNGI